MNIEKELGDCGLCKQKSVEGEASESLWSFTCIKCLDIIDHWNALDNVSFNIKDINQK